MSAKVLPFAVLLASSLAVAAAQPEETFTEIDRGADAVNPEKLIPMVEQGDVRAMNNIGLLWARGIGVPAPNFAEALRWWKEAARRGYPVAMNNIGLLYANGHGVPRDYKEALKWWQMAAEQGSGWAMNSVGDLYENGHGVDQSYADALDWYKRAAEAGDGLGMFNVAALYENGRGVERSYKTAYDWYTRAADKGIASAMHNLGRMLAEGRGFPADKAEAHAWLTVADGYFTVEDKDEALANGEELRALASALTPSELERSKEIAKNLGERIEERRRVKPIRTSPQDSET